MSHGDQFPIDDDMSEYLQTFLDETEEQLDDLVESMLEIEKNLTDKEELNEAFRLIHSIKGAAGLMGLEQITVLTHRLENRFERFRSGVETLDDESMALVLRCIDFLRSCVDGLRKGDSIGSPTELLEELNRLELRGTTSTKDAIADEGAPKNPDASPSDQVENEDAQNIDPVTNPPSTAEGDSHTQVIIRFREQIPLADLKARLIYNRLSGLGEVHWTTPDLAAVREGESLSTFVVGMSTHHSRDRLMAAADVEGVDSIEVAEPADVDDHAEKPTRDPISDDQSGSEKHSAAPDPTDTAKDNERHEQPEKENEV